MLVLIMGPSGSGKTSVMRRLDYPELKSTTSREMREGEINGLDYHFVSKLEFRRMLDNDEFAEYTDYIGKDLYGFQKRDANKCLRSSDVFIAAVDYKGVLAMREYLGPENVYAISISANVKDLMQWMKERGDGKEKIIERIEHMLDTDEIGMNNKVADVMVENNSNLDLLCGTISKLIILKLKDLNNGPK